MQMAAFDRPYTSNIAKTAIETCPCCKSPRRQFRYEVNEHEYSTTTDDVFSLFECSDCGAWYLDPRPDVSALDIIYPPNYYAHTLSDANKGKLSTDQNSLGSKLVSRAYRLRIAPVTAHCPLNAETKFLDIGCGKGGNLETLRQVFNVQGVGVDISEVAVRFCRQHGFRAYNSRFEDFVPENDEKFDVIHSSHVIEHVDSPRAYLSKAYELLKPGGVCVFITPNTSTWEARLFGKNWGGLHVPRHWTMLNPRSCRVLAKDLGFEYLGDYHSTNGVFWLWTFHSLLQSLVGRRIADFFFPSDHRISKSDILTIGRALFFTSWDVLNLLLQRQSANMMVVMRKPATFCTQ